MTLYLLETRAKNDYACAGCSREIPQGALHFRHDPFPAARIHRGQPVTHWCRACIMAASPGPKDSITRRIRIPIVRVINQPAPVSDSDIQTDLPLFAPAQVQLVGIGRILCEKLLAKPSLIHELNPTEFEEFICDRLAAMGFEPKRVGKTNRKDGGVDVLFWPRSNNVFPFLGAAQIKHHRDPNTKEGPSTVRDFAGTIAGHPINAGLIVTNTSFTPDAEWFCRERAKLLCLRGFADITRWLLNNFSDEAEWREIPPSIELCPGVVIKIR